MNIKEKFFTNYINQLHKNWPHHTIEQYRQLYSPYLVSEQVIDLPQTIKQQAKECIEAFFYLRNQQAYQQYILNGNKTYLNDPGNYSILMSFDFHVDTNQQLKLIEINTNASSFLMAYNLYQTLNIPFPYNNDPLQLLKDSINNELNLFYHNNLKPNILIIDEAPEQQKMYIEFLLYQSLFQQWGWQANIYNVEEIEKNINLINTDIAKDNLFIYNRYCDFYLDNTPNLKQLFNNRSYCFSPHPYEYYLLADKKRLVDIFNWSAHLPNNISKILNNVIIPAYDVQKLTYEQLWEMRKNLFFKPKNSYGGKQSYYGKNITTKVAQQIFHENFIAQQIIRPEEIIVKTITGDLNYKYDLRFYVYQDQIHLAIARIYRGQLTNFQDPYGGLTAIRFK